MNAYCLILAACIVNLLHKEHIWNNSTLLVCIWNSFLLLVADKCVVGNLKVYINQYQSAVYHRYKLADLLIDWLIDWLISVFNANLNLMIIIGWKNMCIQKTIISIISLVVQRNQWRNQLTSFKRIFIGPFSP